MANKKEKIKSYYDVALTYANDVASGRKNAGADVVAACQRFLDDLKRDDLELRRRDPDVVINLIRSTMVHMKGEDLEGRPLMGRPFMFDPWEIFITYNLFGFWYAGTNDRRFKEAFIMLGRKNGKTSAVGGLAWASSILQRASGSTTSSSPPAPTRS